jgi:tripartite ATP-independent transporter DctM subunit
MLVGLYTLWLVAVAIFRPEWAPSMPDEELRKFYGTLMFRRIVTAFVLPGLLVLAVLGSIFFGIASPTEAAAVGALGATLLTVFQGKFSLRTLYSVMIETTHLTCMVFIILVGAAAFGLVFRGMQGDTYLTSVILGAQLSPYAFLLLVMTAIFIAGFFIDFIEITFIIVPVVAPIFAKLGIDMLWLGVLIAMNLQTSFLTPPFGFSLFYLKGVAPPEISTSQIYRGIVPFVILQLVGLLLVALFPEMVTWLPKYLATN